MTSNLTFTLILLQKTSQFTLVLLQTFAIILIYWKKFAENYTFFHTSQTPVKSRK